MNRITQSPRTGETIPSSSAQTAPEPRFGSWIGYAGKWLAQPPPRHQPG